MNKILILMIILQLADNNKILFILQCHYLHKAHSCEKTPLMTVFQPGTYYTVESTEAIQYLAED